MDNLKKDGAVKLAERAAATEFKDFNEAEVLEAKKAILDTFGVMLAATTLGVKCHDFVELAKEMGGVEEATIIGYGGKVPAALAAFANGAMNHALDFDTCYDISGTHPTVSTLPAAMALMEKTGKMSGKDLLTAVIVGSDVVYRVGLATSSKAQKDYGVFACYAKSFFGAAAAAAKMLDLDAKDTASCYGLNFAQQGSTMMMLYETDSNLRETFPAFSGKAAVISALLAQKGVKGIRDSLEGRAGYYNSLVRGSYDPAPVDVKIGDRFMNTQITIKPYPSCRQTHMFIDAIKNIMTETGIKAKDIKKVTIKAGQFGQSLCVPEDERRKPPIPMDAKFSIPYCVAAYAVKEQVGVTEFTVDGIKDPEVLEFAKRIYWTADDSIDTKPLVEAGGIIVETMDGKVFENDVVDSYGSPGNPMDVDGVIAKFKGNAAYAKKPLNDTQIERIIELCMNLEKINDISELIALLS